MWGVQQTCLCKRLHVQMAGSVVRNEKEIRLRCEVQEPLKQMPHTDMGLTLLCDQAGLRWIIGAAGA